MTLLLPYRRPLLGLPFCRNGLWLRARAVPSLDVPFADNKSLVDAITGRQLISYARAGSGAYTDSAGVLRMAGVDEPRFDHRIISTTTNLATRSEEFDNATWVRTGINAFGSGSFTNAIAAPDGTVTADEIDEDTSTGFHRVSQALISGTVETGTYTASVYVKANQRSRAYISLDDNATGGVTAGFALLTQAFNITTAGSWSGSTASIEDVGNGWFRISLTSTKGDGSSALTLHVGIAQISTTTISYTGNGTAGLYVWGAQLVRSDSKGQYVRTGAAAASVSTTESLGLLVEEQRTNLRLNSATYQPTSGGAPAAYTVDQVAPDGTTTGSRQTAATPRTFEDYTGIANALYTFSFYCRVTSGTAAFSIQLKNAATDTVITSDTSPVATTTWRRFTISGTTAGATPGARVELVGVVPGFVFWGAQLEAAATASSYIPTTTAAATRNADVVQITGTNFSSWYRQDEGTWLGDAFREFAVPAGQFPVIVDARTTGASPNVNQFSYLLESIAGTFIAVGGAVQSELYPPVPGGTRRRRVASAYAANNFAASVNGSTPLLDSTGSVGSVTSMTIGSVTGSGQYLNGTIRRLVYWGQRLPNNVLQAITQ